MTAGRIQQRKKLAMAPKPEPKMPWAMRIVLVLATIALLLYWVLMAGRSMGVSERGRTAAMIQALQIAGVAYAGDNGPFPKSLDNHMFWRDISGADSGKVYMPFRTSQVNEKGEIIDSWGTPLRIRYISGQEISIDSAGNDKVFGTQDDITSY